MTKMIVAVLCASALLLAQGDEPPCGYLRRGDLWMLVGASETGIDQYRQAVQVTIDHFHPGSGIRLVNRGVWGRVAADVL